MKEELDFSAVLDMKWFVHKATAFIVSMDPQVDLTKVVPSSRVGSISSYR